MKSVFLRILVIVAAAVAAIGCFKDPTPLERDPIKPPKGKVLVLLSTNAERFQRPTRGGTADENAVGAPWIFVFGKTGSETNPDNFIFVEAVRAQTNGVEMYAPLSPSNEPRRILVLANAHTKFYDGTAEQTFNIENINTFFANKTFAASVKSFMTPDLADAQGYLPSLTSPYTPNLPIPMSEICDVANIDENTVIDDGAGGQLLLPRIVAKVTVSVMLDNEEDVLDSFDWVTVANVSRRATYYPATPDIAPALMVYHADSQLLTGLNIIGGDYIIAETIAGSTAANPIYVYETAAGRGQKVIAHINSQYYSLDFVNASGAQMAIERNKHYEFRITSLKNRGYSTIEDALAGSSSNLKYDILVSDLTSHDLMDNGLYHIGVSNSETWVYSDDVAADVIAVTVSTNATAAMVATMNHIVVDSGNGLTINNGTKTLNLSANGSTPAATEILINLDANFTSGVFGIYLGNLTKMIYITRKPSIGNVPVRVDGEYVSAVLDSPGAGGWFNLSPDSQLTNAATNIVYTAPGSIYIAPTKNTADAPRIGGVGYLSRTGTAGRLKVVATQGAYNVGESVDLLYFANDGTLQVGKWKATTGGQINNDNIAFFMFGSTVGIVGTEQEFVSGDVKFNPNTSQTTYTIYEDIPRFDDNDWDKIKSSNDIDSREFGNSENSYHNLANVKAGKGDPCRLAGMTADEIKAMTSNYDLYMREYELAEVKGSVREGWRLPTVEENVRDFVRGPAPNVSTWTREGDVIYHHHFLAGSFYFGEFSIESSPFYVVNGSSRLDPDFAYYPIINGASTPNFAGQYIPLVGGFIHSDGENYTNRLRLHGFVAGLWPSTAYSSDRSCLTASLDAGYVYPHHYEERTGMTISNSPSPNLTAFNIRCVRHVKEAPVAPSGMHAPPGVLGVGAISGTLTLVGSKAYKGTYLETNSDFGPVATEDVFITYFKWGSLVGVWSRANNDEFDVDDIAWGPDNYNLDALKSSIGNKTAGDAWALIPKSTASDAGQEYTSDIMTGLGDPCGFATISTSSNSLAGTTWVTPGDNNLNINAPGNGWGGFGGSSAFSAWLSANTAPINALDPGRYVLADESIFMPAAGLRSSPTGAVSQHRSFGYYWANTAFNATHGRALSFTTIGSIFSWGSAQYFDAGFAVRCVRGVTPPSGMHAAPGVLGATASGKLTLKGSKVYASNDTIREYAEEEFGGLESEDVYMLNFKWGSVVGTWSREEGDEFDSSDLAWAPSGYDLNTLKANIGTQTGSIAWNLIPYSTATAHDQEITIDIAAGKGDPCVFADKGNGDAQSYTYVTPPAKDAWSAYWNHSTFSTVWYAANALGDGIPAGRMSQVSKLYEQSGWFFPVAGTRADSGLVLDINTSGYYWSSTSVTPTGGRILALDSSGTYFEASLISDYGAAIRCVREPVAPSGMHAPPGVLGAKADGTLTLRGSQIYSANSTIANYATTEFGGLENEDVYILNFKWGSVVGIWNREDGDLFDVSDIAWAPPGYNLDQLKTDIGTKFSTPAWNLVPAGSASAGQEITINIAAGQGDPCAFAEKGNSSYSYRTPAHINEKWNGTAYTHATGSLQLRWFDANNDIPAGRLSRVSGEEGWFFPAAGVRNYTTGILNIFSNGYSFYWSSSNNTSEGLLLSFSNEAVYPNSNSSLNNGYVVRCVREPVAPSGMHAPPGVLGVGATTGQLTLIGSKAYAGTAMETNSEFGPVANEDVFITYFKWGSVVGTWSRATGDEFDVDDIAWAAPDYNLNALKTSVRGAATPSAAWSQIPYAIQAMGSITAGAIIPANTTANNSLGGGDPCAFATKGTATGTYVTPAGNAEADGGWGDFGLTHANSPWRSIAQRPYALYAGRWANDWNHMFLPTAGYRNSSSGRVYSQQDGTNGTGYYWSNTSGVSNARHLSFTNVTLGSANETSHTNGYAVRCVREVPPPSGMHAAPGVLGATAGGKLTLRGSQIYAANNDILTYANTEFGGLENEDVYVLHFKWGSVVGSWSRVINDVFDVSDIAWAPPGYDLRELKRSIGIKTANDAWGFVPGSPPTGSGQPITINIAAGQGDPCAFAVINASGDLAGSTWITPAAATATTWNDIAYTTTNLTWSAAGVLGQGIPAGRMPQVDGQTEWFFPAAGSRLGDTSGTNAGNVSGLGTTGHYWSSTASSNTNARTLSFGGNTGNVNVATARSGIGGSIRCVDAIPPTLTVSPDALTFNPTTDGGGTQNVTVTTNKTWQVTNVSEAWITVSPALNTATPSSTTTLTVGVNAANPNLGNTPRTGTITVSAGGLTQTIAITQSPWPWGGEGDILYIEGTGDNAVLRVGKWNNGTNGGVITSSDQIVYFKYGGVVGFNCSGTFGTTSVLFNPTPSSISKYGSSNTDINNTLPNVPAALRAQTSLGSSVSDPSYHNADNIKNNGRGDPCKLVGLTAAQVRTMSDAALNSRSNEWRLATAVENAFFAGGNLDGTTSTADRSWILWNNGTSSYNLSNSTFSHWSVGDGTRANPSIAALPVRAGYFSQGSSVLPAVGYRSAQGDVFGTTGNYGYYWSGTATSATTTGYCMSLGGTLDPVDYLSYSFGLAVRCVRQE